ncbi:ATP-binding cassette domain-containing protein [Neisseriaceae bacterium JH1-16]|nr:ATP-binding cassette domain-containing protein [Neisseriaceae bacterium JH1-16]
MSLLFDRVSLSLGGSPVLHEISLALADGEQAALIGPSGAGKTSLLLLANTVRRPNAGQLQLLGQAPWSLPGQALRSLRRDIGTVYQSPPLPPRQRVVNAVAAGRLGSQSLAASLAQLVLPRDTAAIETALTRVNLGERLWERCDQLSGGQRQRVGIARVLYQAPRLLLADEPVSALDPRLAEQTVRLLTDEARSRNATLLMSLHSVELALAFFPRLIGVRQGRVMFDLPREAVSEAQLAALYADEQPNEPRPIAEPLPWNRPC